MKWVNRFALILLPTIALSLLAISPEVARAQSDDSVYSVGNADNAPDANGPVRMARVSLVDGHATWRPDGGQEWSDLSLNIPLRQGAEVYVPSGSRVELQFDDGSRVRLAAGASIVLQTMYADDQGEFTELKLTNGLTFLNLRNDRSIYQVDTPSGSLKAVGPARLRVGTDTQAEIGVLSGRATWDGAGGQATLNEGDFLRIEDPAGPYSIRPLPRADSWLQWNDERDDYLDHGSEQSQQYLPENVYVVADNLDYYGTWHDVPTYGHVWCPRVHSDWRPYHDGHWVWCNPFGWTWCDDAPWGWAPCHYGTWVHLSYGWGWCPGPRYQYWSPAVVSFSVCNDACYWTPLCPGEVAYPTSFGLGFGSHGWWLSLSLGTGCGAYYPVRPGFCEARRWRSDYCNRFTYVSDRYYGNGHAGDLARFHNSAEFYAGNGNTFDGNGFVPRNAQFGGSSRTPLSGFGSARGYDAPTGDVTSILTHGRTVGAPQAGRQPSIGPAALRPDRASLTVARSFGTPPPAAATDRRVYRAPLPEQIARAVGQSRNGLETADARAPQVDPRIPYHTMRAPAGGGAAERPSPPDQSPRRLDARQTLNGDPAAGVQRRQGQLATSPNGAPDAVLRARREMGFGGGGSESGGSAPYRRGGTLESQGTQQRAGGSGYGDGSVGRRSGTAQGNSDWYGTAGRSGSAGSSSDARSRGGYRGSDAYSGGGSTSGRSRDNTDWYRNSSGRGDGNGAESYGWQRGGYGAGTHYGSEGGARRGGDPGAYGGGASTYGRSRGGSDWYGGSSAGRDRSGSGGSGWQRGGSSGSTHYGYGGGSRPSGGSHSSGGGGSSHANGGGGGGHSSGTGKGKP